MKMPLHTNGINLYNLPKIWCSTLYWGMLKFPELYIVGKTEKRQSGTGLLQ